MVRTAAWEVTAQRDGELGVEREARAAVAANPLWYHAMELAPGVETPGWFDLRPIVDKLPWPDVRGKRCLDIGTYDGFLAFELERRGAAEVVATDISDHDRWDWPPRLRAAGPQYIAAIAGQKGAGFAIARELLGSSVEHRELSVYDLAPGEELGTFDVVVCGSLLLHLRDPLWALEAIRSVCDGWFLSADHVELRLSLVHPRTPLVRVDGTSSGLHWWRPSTRGHRQMLEAAGFDVERESGIYAIPFGVGHPVRRERRSARRVAAALARRAVAGNDGVPHHAVLARPIA
jgi:tRNA (mo5U34)-methyltransferase